MGYNNSTENICKAIDCFLETHSKEDRTFNNLVKTCREHGVNPLNVVVPLRKYYEKEGNMVYEFIMKEIPFDSLVMNGGIYETPPLANGLTIGVSLEEKGYYLNLFNGAEYIDIANGKYVSTKEEIVSMILEYMEGE